MIVSAVLLIIVGFAAVDAAPDINVALNKPANLSRQYTISYPDVTADKAVDGNTNQDFDERSCFHTEKDPENWWYVDLEDIYILTTVKLYNRLLSLSNGTDISFADRARNIKVLVGNTLNNMKQVAYEPDQIDDIHTFVLPCGTRGRYVKLVHAANDYFHLCEVEVFSPADRARNIKVLVGDSLDSMTQMAYEPDQIDDIHSFVMTPGTKGRYVKLEHSANDYFHLCEVQVYTPKEDDINVALNKPAALSRQYTISYPDLTADKAVDGNTSQDLDRRSCFHTEKDPVNWWYVDLQQIYTLTTVKLYNRLISNGTDISFADRAKNITVLVGNSLDSMTQVAYEPDQIDDIHSFVMPCGTRGRYVKLLQAANEYFHLCEVQVFARAGSGF